MTTKLYNIYLDGKLIGTTELEKADVPMGVLFGAINFTHDMLDYKFFKKYCLDNSIELAYEQPEEKLIATRTISGLKITNENGAEIKGSGNQISGMDGDGFEVILEGVPYPFFEEEFTHHVKAYNEHASINSATTNLHFLK